MKLLCAWCEKEGKPALIAEVEPKNDPTPTHGMCPAHRAEAEKEIEVLRQKEAERHREEQERHREEVRRHLEADKDLEALREKVDP